MRWLPMLVAVLSLGAAAEGDPRYAALREKAQALPSAAAFLDRYLGACGTAAAGGQPCLDAVAAFRKSTTGKPQALLLTDGTSGLLQVGEVDEAQGTFSLQFTPFLAGGAAAITHGAPARTDAQGNPLLPFLRLEASLPEGWTPALLKRQVQAQALQVEVVFTPLGPWALPGKGGARIQGVKARFDAVLVTVARTGQPIGLWLPR